MWRINNPCPWQSLLFPLLDKTSPVQGSALHLPGVNDINPWKSSLLQKCTPPTGLSPGLHSWRAFDSLGWKSQEGEWIRLLMWAGTSLKAPPSHSPLCLWALLIQRTTIFSLGKNKSSYTFHPRGLALPLGNRLLN